MSYPEMAEPLPYNNPINPSTDSNIRFFPCTCGCNAIAIESLFEDNPNKAQISVQMWEPRAGGTTLRWRIWQAWRTLWNKGSMDETIISKTVAIEMAQYLWTLAQTNTNAKLPTSHGQSNDA